MILQVAHKPMPGSMGRLYPWTSLTLLKQKRDQETFLPLGWRDPRVFALYPLYGAGFHDMSESIESVEGSDPLKTWVGVLTGTSITTSDLYIVSDGVRVLQEGVAGPVAATPMK